MSNVVVAPSSCGDVAEGRVGKVVFTYRPLVLDPERVQRVFRAMIAKMSDTDYWQFVETMQQHNRTLADLSHE